MYLSLILFIGLCRSRVRVLNPYRRVVIINWALFVFQLAIVDKRYVVS